MPLLQVQECIFYKMTKPIQIFVIWALTFPIVFRRYDNLHASTNGIGDNRIGIIAPVSKQNFDADPFN